MCKGKSATKSEIHVRKEGEKEKENRITNNRKLLSLLYEPLLLKRK